MATTNVGTPDWQRGTVGAGKLLARVTAGTTTVTVDVPPNAQTLAISYAEDVLGETAIVTGVTSGLSYPGIQRKWANGLGGDPLYLFSVLPALDSQVTIALAPGPTIEWFVYSMTATEIVDVPELAGLLVDLNNVINQQGVLVAGYDGTRYQALRVDTHGELFTLDQNILLALQPVGGSLPAGAVLMGGSDGVHLQALRVDTNGELFTLDQNILLALKPVGGSLPAGAVLMGGSDGVNLQALSTDMMGTLSVSDQILDSVVAYNGTGPATQSLMVGGTDQTGARVFSTDANGRQIPLVPDLTTGSQTIGGGRVLLPLLSSGAYYLFGLDVYTAAGGVDSVIDLDDGVTLYCQVHNNISYPTSVQLNGYRTTGPVNGYCTDNLTSAIVRYALGP